MKKLILGFIVLFALGALADVTVTYFSASAKVDSVIFSAESDGGISFVVCGHDTATNTSPVSNCTQTGDVPVGATQTAVLNIFSGAALNQYKNTNGL